MESDSRIQLICHKENRGVGAAICSGYKTSLENEVDIAVVMAGDAQMDPENLESLILPVAEEGVDYTKGNRLFDKKAWEIIPRHRYIGNSILSLLRKLPVGIGILQIHNVAILPYQKKPCRPSTWTMFIPGMECQMIY